MEVTCRIQRPLEKIGRLKKELPDFAVGAASLIDFPQMLTIYNKVSPDDPLPSVEQAVDVGADYLVSAVNFSNISYEKFAGKIAMIPGCGSATEIVNQFSKGANFCKLFPAKQIGGSVFIKAIDPAIHKLISIVPTGGTNTVNMPDYIATGVLVLSGSFSMIEKSAMLKITEQQDYDLLADELKKVKEVIDRHRKQVWPNIDFGSATVERISTITGRNFNIG